MICATCSINSPVIGARPFFRGTLMCVSFACESHGGGGSDFRCIAATGHREDNVTYRAIAVLPQSAFSAAAIQRAVEGALDELAANVQADFQATVATWDDAPSFVIRKRPSVREIATGQRTYVMLNAGTAPHTIRVQQARRLVFQVPYKAKSAPRLIGSGPGARGNTTVYARDVHHPGTAPREWDQVIAEKYRGVIAPTIQQAISAAVRR